MNNIEINTQMNSDLSELFVNRKGISIGSFMKTNKLICKYQPNINLKYKHNNIKQTNKNNNEKLIIPNIPKHIYISGDLEEENNINVNVLNVSNISNTNGSIVNIENCNKSNDISNNILGKNKVLMINNTELIIPIVDTTDENLAYYHCRLINNKDVFTLEGKQQVGYFEMTIGAEYLQNYLLQKEYGNGCYIEYHDQPHFYIFKDYYNKICKIDDYKGYLIIGKKIGKYYVLSAFKIPTNKGIYIPPGVYHCDGCLVGKYNVIYSKTENYETLLLKNLNKNILNISFKN